MLYTISHDFCFMNMGKETEKILQLLSYWKEFTEKESGDLSAFGKWLEVHANDQQEVITHTTEAATSFRDQYIHDEVSVEDRIVLLWGRLQRFTHLWSKKALKDLPLHSIEEFGLIKTVELLREVRKSDLVKHTLMETSTCFEMIKRLVKAGYLEEKVDPKDRRSRKVSLTQKGRLLSEESEPQIKMLSRLLIGNINQSQKLALLDVLHTLDGFHSELYIQKPDSPLEDMLP